MNVASLIQDLQQLLPQCLLPDQVRLGARLAHFLAGRRGGAPREALLTRWIAEARNSIRLRERRGTIREHIKYPPDLPILARREEIVARLREHPVVVIAGETGSGKTTQLPKMLLEAGLGIRARIGCTQPRRLAALSTARRLAEELGVHYGREVGSKIRFNDRVSGETAVKVMTDGILLAEVQSDPLLTDYEALIVDEAHERSLNIDFLLGHLRNLLGRRDDLKLVVTSATIDTRRFAEAFGGAPVLEVSGRMFPVQVRYRPPAVPDADEEHEGETYVDAAVSATEEVLAESASGDVLVFMPGERDIRETSERLGRALKGRVDVVPLFGRLSGAEQDAIFHPGPARRVVVATNIAETSLTVPRIRYVIDTGLARISRYHPGTRCRRLPVEPIARSNADQRQGRCGRVTEGICVRLYAEADYGARPAFADPEIRRCNLADVVLRLKAFRLGEAETFPFIDPPPPAALRGAYVLLQELGALNEARELTELGRELARLPVDPAMGRMLLEARREKALAEVLVIAGGLSIQDPRERPMDRRDEAEAAHRRFNHPESDFLALLNIWEAYHDTWESLGTQNQLRRFCREHYLSFLRMREWVDLHAQLAEAMEDLGESVGEGPRADYAAIHRSLLAGLVGHVGQRKEVNLYRLAGEREMHAFPGSGLFVKPGARRAVGANPAGQAPTPRPKPTQPAWIVAGEIVETTRSYARTAARIDPEWVLEVAPHVVRQKHVRPRWDRRSGRVLVTEQDLLRGLVLRERPVDYVRVDPAAATEMFIREALVTQDLEGHHEFLESNDRLMQKIELWQTRLRQRVIPDLEEALVSFYAQRLQGVGSIHDLNRVLKSGGRPDLLCATAADLLGEQSAGFESGGLPEVVTVGRESLPVRYAYAPGEATDGVTLRLSVPLAEVVDPQLLEWAVPALREERVLHLLRGLPKALRRPLMPLDATMRAILQAVDAGQPGFLTAMSRFVGERYGVEVEVDAWPVQTLPEHARPRFEVVGGRQEVLTAGRDLPALVEQLRGKAQSTADPCWEAGRRQWERAEVTDWAWGDLPAELVLGDVGGFPVRAYPGLETREGVLNLRLFRQPQEARSATAEGVPRLAERVTQRELVWVQKDLRDLKRHQVLHSTLGSLDELLETGWEHARAHLFPRVDWSALQERSFRDYVDRARELMPGLVGEMSARVGRVLEKRQELLLCRTPLPRMREELDALVPARFLALTPWDRLGHLPRYLHALLVRAQRAALNPAKDREKQARIQPYLDTLRRLQGAGSDPAKLAALRWLVEEYKVSVFAQELGTAVPVSPRRLDEVKMALQ